MHLITDLWSKGSQFSSFTLSLWAVVAFASLHRQKSKRREVTSATCICHAEQSPVSPSCQQRSCDASSDWTSGMNFNLLNVWQYWRDWGIYNAILYLWVCLLGRLTWWIVGIYAESAHSSYWLWNVLKKKHLHELIMSWNANLLWEGWSYFHSF